MKRRVHLRKKYVLFSHSKRRHSKINLVVITFIFLMIALFFVFRFINKRLTPILFDYAELESKRIATLIVNNAVTTELAKALNVDDLFIATKDSTGEIKTIDFNPVIVNQVLGQVTNNIHQNLKYLEEGKIDSMSINPGTLSDYDQAKLKKGIIYQIPSGVVFKNSLLSNLGPKIPVKLSIAGDIFSNVVTNIKNYGINNALVEVNIYVEITEKVILPFTSKNILVKNTIPVAIKLIQGTVPNYYFNGMSQNSPSVTFPVP